MKMNQPVLCGRNRSLVIDVFYKQFQQSHALRQACTDIKSLFQRFDVGVASCCCRCYYLIKNSSAMQLSDGCYLLAAVYVLFVLSEDEIVSLVDELSKLKQLALHLFSWMEDDSHLDFFVSCYHKIRIVTRNHINPKLRILSRSRCKIFPLPSVRSNI